MADLITLFLIYPTASTSRSYFGIGHSYNLRFVGSNFKGVPHSNYLALSVLQPFDVSLVSSS